MVSDQWLEDLEKLKEEKGLYVDPESVRQGEGTDSFPCPPAFQDPGGERQGRYGKEFQITDMAGEHSTVMKFAGVSGFL